MNEVPPPSGAVERPGEREKACSLLPLEAHGEKRRAARGQGHGRRGRSILSGSGALGLLR